MKNKMIVFTLALAAAGVTSRAHAQNRPQGTGIDNVCFDVAKSNVQIWKQQNKPADEIERLHQQALAACSGASPEVSAFVASVNFDLARFVRRYLAGGIASNLYIALSRDRGRKLRHGLRNPAWIQAFALGDVDGDLIPDSLDLCPGTPDQTPTTDNGCPSTQPLPPAPNAETVKRLLSRAGLLLDPDCASAPVPNIASPVRAGYELITNAYLMGLLHLNNQPNNCAVAYEVRITYSERRTSAVPLELTLGAVFAREESINHTNTSATYQVFRVPQGTGGPRGVMWDKARNYSRYLLKFRVMNGSGMSSGWSEAVELPSALWQPLKPL